MWGELPRAFRADSGSQGCVVLCLMFPCCAFFAGQLCPQQISQGLPLGRAHELPQEDWGDVLKGRHGSVCSPRAFRSSSGFSSLCSCKMSAQVVPKSLRNENCKLDCPNQSKTCWGKAELGPFGAALRVCRSEGMASIQSSVSAGTHCCSIRLSGSVKCCFPRLAESLCPTAVPGRCICPQAGRWMVPHSVITAQLGNARRPPGWVSHCPEGVFLLRFCCQS